MPVHAHLEVSDAVVPAADFVLADWCIQPTLNRAVRNGTTIHLRPQLVDVLVCLARNPGQTVTRGELMDRVWRNQFVADTAIARCVAELRQALGDQAQSPILIETIPKRGYRLIARVSPTGGNGTIAPQAVVEANPLPPAPLDVPNLVPHDTSADGTVPGEQAEAVAPALRLWQRAARNPRRLAIALGLTIILTITLTAALTWWLARDRAAGTAILAGRDPIVLSFTNATGEPVFDDTLRLALAIQFEQSPSLRVTTTVQTPELAMQVCGRVGASSVLHGSITPMGQRYVVGLEASACGSRDIIARAQAEAPGREQVLEALTRAADTMRHALGETTRPVSGRSAERLGAGRGTT